LIGKVLIIHGKRERLDKMANKEKKVEVPETIMVHCTDNGQDVEVNYISQHNGIIRTDLQGMPLYFKHHRANIYVGNMLGREFVMKL
jgi:hypothetical protein